jgi:hypothetical protein
LPSGANQPTRDLDPYEYLKSALERNQRIAELLVEVYSSRAEYLAYLDKLVRELFEGGVQATKEKLGDVDNLRKFDSVVSELEVARLLMQKGKRIRLLTDNEWEGKSPDMISGDQEHEALVEVKRITDDEANDILTEGLRQYLPTLATPLRVDIQLKGGLVLPVVDRVSREKKEKLAKDCLEEFKDRIATSGTTDPPPEVHTGQADFFVFKTSNDKGFPGIISTGIFAVPEPLIITKLVFDVALKAGKRASWTNELRARPYIIALDSENLWLDADTVRMAFLGLTTELHASAAWEKIEILPEVETARRQGWEGFLTETCQLPNKELRCYLLPGHAGSFLTDKRMQDVSAVLVRTASGRYYFLPNPFAAREINFPSLGSFIVPRVSGF